MAGVDDADVVILDKQDVVGSGVGSAEADAVQAPVHTQDDDIRVSIAAHVLVVVGAWVARGM